MAEGKLNLDIGEKVSELEAVMTRFQIKNILYRLIFRGKGLEFDGYREYTHDDDAGMIDWKATSRSDKTLVKKYIEERDLKIVFVIDVSENMVFGSTDKLKCEYAAELAAALAHLIITSNDKIGFVFYADGIKKEVLNLKTGKKRFNLFIGQLENPSFYGGDSNLKVTLDYLLDTLDESTSAVVLISDFLRLNEDVSKSLKLFAGKFETMAFMVRDPLDRTLPDIKGEVVLEDPKSGEQIIVDPSVARRQYEEYTKRKDKEIKKLLENSRIDFKELSTKQNFSPEVASFLKRRAEEGKFITS